MDDGLNITKWAHFGLDVPCFPSVIMLCLVYLYKITNIRWVKRVGWGVKSGTCLVLEQSWNTANGFIYILVAVSLTEIPQ